MQRFGLVSNEEERIVSSSFRRMGEIYMAVMDRESLWDPATIDKIMKAFPKGYIDDSDLFLILAECIANAVLHGQAQVLGLQARKRGAIVLISFFQIPPMPQQVRTALTLARQGRLKECSEEMPGGLGFPILLRLVGKITVSGDLTRVQLWIRR